MKNNLVNKLAIGCGIVGIICSALVHNWSALLWAICATLWMVVALLQSLSIADLKKVIRHYNENRI